MAAGSVRHLGVFLRTMFFLFAGSWAAITRRYQVLDIDIAMETIMNSWFEQRHENRRLLAKTIEAHRVIENGEQRLSFARLVVYVYCQPRPQYTTYTDGTRAYCPRSSGTHTHVVECLG